MRNCYLLRTLYAALLVLGVLPASHAQVGLPALPGLPAGIEQPLAPVLSRADRQLSELRDLRIRSLLRGNRHQLDVDPRGELVVRNEIVLLAPRAETLQRALRAGFVVQRELALAPLALQAMVLRAPDRLGTRQALRKLRRLDPEAELSFNHIYLDSGAQAQAASSPEPVVLAHPLSRAVGLIDSGVDAQHPTLQGVRVEHWGCEGERSVSAHGTAVASLLAGHAAGPAPPGSHLYAADIYCDQATGGAVDNLAQALAWLASHDVKVINLSLVGADNPLLKHVVAAMLARGHLLVAAVGNDGPASPPLYPAAYPGVIGVTAVDRRQRLLPEALRGQQVAFAAPGGNLRAAAPAQAWQSVRGTSFAAPLVARMAAALWRPGESSAQATLRLQAQAVDLGARGRDNRFGFGLLGIDLPVQYATPN